MRAALRDWLAHLAFYVLVRLPGPLRAPIAVWADRVADWAGWRWTLTEPVQVHIVDEASYYFALASSGEGPVPSDSIAATVAELHLLRDAMDRRAGGAA
ncbi:hypothetical protein [Streptomyces mesophilus]|uniref:hypothetical protein n=1 Tax=Streptomyces mesophilus TaxID=1775132 RepID=UPI00331DE54B